MGLLDKLFSGSQKLPSSGAIEYGRQKKDGGHNHTYNKGDDQTPAQKKGHEQATKTKAEKSKV